VRRRGKAKAQAAVCSTQLKVCHAVPSSPGGRFQDLGVDCYDRQCDASSRPLTTSASSARSGSRSPSVGSQNPSGLATTPDGITPRCHPHPALLRSAGCCRAPTDLHFRSIATDSTFLPPARARHSSLASVLANASSPVSTGKIAPRLPAEASLVAVCLRHLGVADVIAARKLGLFQSSRTSSFLKWSRR